MNAPQVPGRGFRNRLRIWRLPLVLLLVLSLFTLMGLMLVLNEQRVLLERQAGKAGQSELEVIGGFARESLARGDYSVLERFLRNYAEGRPDVHRLVVESGNGNYTWLDYGGPSPESGVPRFHLEERVEYGRDRSVLLRMEVVTPDVRSAVDNLRVSLTMWGGFGVLLFALILWYSIERMGLAPLRRERDRLEGRVAERTRALEVALDEVSAKARELERQATHDHLTGLYNRLKFEAFLDEEIERAQRYGNSFALVLCDIDHFKAVNDTHGHEAGDRVLIEVTRELMAQLRRPDRAARWGGEEFVLLLPQTDLHEAAALAERLREAFAHRETGPGEGIGPVTLSFGVTAWKPGDTRQRLLLRADQALYRAKEEGRNRVVTGRF